MKPFLEYATPARPIVRSWRPDLTVVALVAIVASANLCVGVLKWPDYNVFGCFAVIWFVIGVLSLGAGLVGCRWFSVVAALVLAAVAFCANAHYLSEITASC